MKVLMWGGSSQCRICIEMVREIYGEKAKIIGIVDPYIESLPFDSQIKFHDNCKQLGELLKEATHYVICIGGEHGYARQQVSNIFLRQGLKPIDLISKTAILDSVDTIKSGLQVMAGAIVHKFATLGEQCIINTNSTVNHECNLGDGCHVMGGASIGGRVSIGNYCSIGMNATILPDIEIGDHVYVGAGAVVTKDVRSRTVVAGVPARFVRAFHPNFDSTPFKGFL